MKRISRIITLLLISLTTACSLRNPTDMLPFGTKKVTYGNEQPYIILQQPNNRSIVTCYNSEKVSSYTCARIFESKGYVRVKDIPYRTANYDILKTDTYPTRRWREGQNIPWW